MNLEYNIRNIKLYLLKKEIQNHDLYSKSGLEYLIEVYKVKSRKKDIQGIAFGAAITSALVSNAINLIFFGTGENFSRFILIYETIKVNKDNIIAMIFSIIIIFVFIKLGISNSIKGLKELFFSQNYKNIIEIIELRFIPDVIKNEDKRIESEFIKNISVKDIEEFSNIQFRQYKKNNYSNKEILNQLSKLNKLKNNKGLSEKEYNKIKQRALEKIKF